jgi:pSer/pThr/pTyr-binding forkhead associated (FHA) protein
MQVILKPVTHPELGEIIIKDSLFPIGRNEPPFSGYDPQFTEKLSRRHARIFEQDDTVYIADLGSLNGTTVNGSRVDTLPIRLQRGDEICLTGYLCYQIEILGAAAGRSASVPESQPVKLVLTPQRRQTVLEPIVVTQFPFLVNKASDVFSRYKETLPEEVSYLSRRHAHIFLRDGNLYIEDLGSTNGTFVSDVRLEEHARQLRDGDVVAFGGDNFVYRVGLVHAEQAEPDQAREDSKLPDEVAEAVNDVTRTTFVTSATSFLDIFCVEDEAADDYADAGGVLARPPEAGKAAESVPASGRPGLAHKSRSMFREMRTAFASDSRGKSGKVWLIGLAGVAIVALGIYFSSAPKREIRELLEQHDYALAVVEANRYLEHNSDDREVNDLATEAALKDVVPTWLELIAAGDFSEAGQEAERGKRLSYSNPSGQVLFDSMLWVTRLEQFMVERGGPDAPVVMFEHESRINDLVAWWEEDSKAHRHSLNVISQYVPDFVELRAQVFSHLRALQSHRSLSVAAIESLLDEVQESLRSGQAESLHTVLGDFENKYSRVAGTKKLRSDLDSYQLIEADLKAESWISAWHKGSETEFQTPIFREQVQRVMDSELPPQDVVNRYDEALADWKQGNTEEAMNSLQELAKERWGEVAERRLQRNNKLISDYEMLKTVQKGSDYNTRLLAFYRTLDPVQDSYYVDAAKEEFQIHRSKALEQAQQAFAASRTAWEKYRERGGIRSLYRLEARVSPGFRQLAELLTDSYEGMAKGSDIYSLLKTGLPAEWVELDSQITNEIRLQRQSLEELTMVLEPSLKQAKLALLPVLQSSDPGGDRSSLE